MKVDVFELFPFVDSNCYYLNDFGVQSCRSNSGKHAEIQTYKKNYSSEKACAIFEIFHGFLKYAFPFFFFKPNTYFAKLNDLEQWSVYTRN